MVDLADSVKGYLGAEVTGAISKLTGESQDKVQSAIGAALPTILAGLVQQGANPQGAGALFAMLKNPPLDSLLSGSAAGLASSLSANGNVLQAGKALLATLFGDKLAKVVEGIAGAVGMKPEAASSVLAAIAPVALAVVGSKSGAGGAAGLAALLGSQSGLLSALPAGLGSLVGAASTGKLGGLASEQKGPKRWPLILGAAVLLGALLLALRGTKQDPQTTTKLEAATEAPSEPAAQPSTATKPVAAAPAEAKAAEPLAAPAEAKAAEPLAAPAEAKAAEPLAAPAEAKAAEPTAAPADSKAEPAAPPAAPAPITAKLPDGTELSFPTGSLEDQWVAALANPNAAADNDKWFNFDRLLFDTGKATLQPASMSQLENVAAIMKAFPKVHIKVGGHTDNRGNAAGNLKLSAARAATVTNRLTTLGVGAARMTAEGYGSTQPTCPANDSDECRAQNRRIAIQVTQK